MPAKKTIGKTTKKITSQVEENLVIEDSSKIKTKKNIFSKKIIVILVAFLLIGLIFYFKDLFIVATVNNQPIFRISLIKEMQKQIGNQVLNGMITRSLILQEASKRNINISAKEVEDEIKRNEEAFVKQGQTLDQVLQMQGLSREELKNEIKLKLIMDKIVSEKPVVITDKDIDQYITDTKYTIEDPSKTAETRESIRKYLAQQKANEKAQQIFQEFKNKAQINYFIKF